MGVLQTLTCSNPLRPLIWWENSTRAGLEARKRQKIMESLSALAHTRSWQRERVEENTRDCNRYCNRHCNRYCIRNRRSIPWRVCTWQKKRQRPNDGARGKFRPRSCRAPLAVSQSSYGIFWGGVEPKKHIQSTFFLWNQIEPVMPDEGWNLLEKKVSRFSELSSEFQPWGTLSNNVRVNPVISWNGHNSFQRILPSNSRHFTIPQPGELFHSGFFFEKSHSNVCEKYWLTKDWSGGFMIPLHSPRNEDS